MTNPGGRFSKLDFQDKVSEAPPPLEDPWPNLDDQACLREGDAAFQRGHYEVALNAYSRALRFNRDLVAAWTGQIRCLLCMGEYPEAVTWSDRALERFSQSPDLLACKGLALVYSGAHEQGVEYLDGAVEMRAPSPWVWLARGESLLHLPNAPVENAQRCFLKAMELAPEDWHLQLRIGIAYNQVSMFARAREHLIKAFRAAKDNPLVLYQTGLAQEGGGECEVAAGLFERALVAQPRFPEAEAALQRVRQRGVFARLWRRLSGR